MEEIGNCENDLTPEELQDALDMLLEMDAAKERRQSLSEQSFKEWVYGILRTVFAKLGYTLVSFQEFWNDVTISIKSGWEEGVELARREAELNRKKRERRHR